MGSDSLVHLSPVRHGQSWMWQMPIPQTLACTRASHPCTANPCRVRASRTDTLAGPCIIICSMHPIKSGHLSKGFCDVQCTTSQGHCACRVLQHRQEQERRTDLATLNHSLRQAAGGLLQVRVYGQSEGESYSDSANATQDPVRSDRTALAAWPSSNWHSKS